MEARWLLESVATDGSRLTYHVSHTPFRIGRDADNDLTVPALGLSRRHANITADENGRLRVTDLESTNGTYVNRRRVTGSCLLAENDIIHFGSAEFRLRPAQPDRSVILAPDAVRTVLVDPKNALSEHFVPNEVQFLELLQGKGLTCAVQPIVAAKGGGLEAFELLGRSNHPGLPQSPMHLFRLAALLKREAELSEAFRNYGVRAMAARLGHAALFVNTHPTETFEESFFTAITKLLEDLPGLNLVVEIHETAVMETERMRELGARLEGAGVRFAYDDFGAGQARLNELGEVPAHFVKFDMSLIRDIHTASERKQRVIRDLVKLVSDLGSISLAEGVEVEAEAQVCREMGFQLIQGYLTGKPVPIESL